jgi:acetolactate synthase I/II/III large subunit
MKNQRTASRVIVDGLAKQGVDIIFQVPGESFLPLLDSLRDSKVRTITCRHEAGAANMAEAYGKLTGRPGVCIVTRGPGACHASVGIHTARQDSTPMVLLVGLVDRPLQGREAFQEIDLDAMFGWTAKWVCVVQDADRLPETIQRAWQTAMSSRPGPVVLGLPEDMLSDLTIVVDADRVDPTEITAPDTEVERALDLLRTAQKPMVIVGGSRWTDEASRLLEAFSEAWDLPVCVTFRRQDRIDNRHSSYVGDLAFAPDPFLVEAIRGADLILALGTRLGDLTTGGYELLKPPKPDQTLIHVYPDPSELGRLYTPDVAVVADPVRFLASCAKATPPENTRRTWSATLQAAFTASLVPAACPGPLDMNVVIQELSRKLGPDDIITLDAGNFAQWVQRYYPFKGFRTQIGPTGGAMGYGIPAGVAAALVRPDRRVVTFVGDGGFMMTSNEMATAVQHHANLVIIVVNNGMFGTIRAHQERRFPGRAHGTDLVNPDFVAMAEAIGFAAFRVRETIEISATFDHALKHDGPALVELVLDPEAISSRASLSKIRAAAQISATTRSM